jgi:hypothetical protein
MRVDSPGVKLLDTTNLIWLQAGCITDYVLDVSSPPVMRKATNPSESERIAINRLVEFDVRVKLQEERCEQWVSDAGGLPSLLLCDNASLSRLSITISVHKSASRPLIST